MFLFGHTGLAVGAAHFINRRFSKKIDLRYVAVLSMAADIIDKPIGLSAPEFFHFNTRLIAHNFFFAVFVAALFLAFSPRKGNAIILWLFYFSHHLLDRMWSKSPDIFFFPFGGPVQWHEPNLVKRWTDVLKTPYTLGGEVFGFAILTTLFLSYRLYVIKNFRRFMREGVLRPN